jgi:hypothetical protein
MFDAVSYTFFEQLKLPYEFKCIPNQFLLMFDATCKSTETSI